MKIINTVEKLVWLRSIPDSKTTKYQELLNVVIFIGVLLGAILSENTVVFFKARSK